MTTEAPAVPWAQNQKETMNYQNNTQTTVGAPIAVDREVPSKANGLRESLDNLGNVVGNLEDRLMCVMRTSAPEKEVGVKGIEGQVCEVANMFYQSQRNVDAIAARVQSLLNRLEI